MDILKQLKEKMEAALEHLRNELKAIRTDRANPGILDGVMVDVYGGSQMRIKDLASVTTPESRQLLLTPFDVNNKAAIAKAIERANLGIVPIVDGNLVRIKIPPMDESVRKDMVKLCQKRKEEAKISIRNIRRDFNELARKLKSSGDLAEDQLKKLEKQIQDATDDFCSKADGLAEKREKEVTAI